MSTITRYAGKNVDGYRVYVIDHLGVAFVWNGARTVNIWSYDGRDFERGNCFDILTFGFGVQGDIPARLARQYIERRARAMLREMRADP